MITPEVLKSFSNNIEKVSAYYHGHTISSIAKKMKSGLKAGDYIARRTHVGTAYASQYGKKGAMLKLNIPKHLRKEYLETDPANQAALMFGAGLPKHMKRAYVLKKDIPAKWISKKKINPNLARQKAVKKEIMSTIDPSIIKQMQSMVDKM